MSIVLPMLLLIVVAAVFLLVLARYAPKTTLVLAPIVAAATASVHGTTQGTELLVGFDVLLWPWALFAILFFRHHNGTTANFREIIRGAMWVLGFLYCLCAAAGLMGLGIVLLPMYVAAFFRYRRRKIESRAALLLALLRSCMRHQLPLPNAFHNAAKDELDDGLSIILVVMANALESGQTLEQALTKAWPSCPGQLKATLIAGERTNQLAEAVERLYTDLLTEFQLDTKQLTFVRSYALVLMFVLLAVLHSNATLVLPSMQKLVHKFGGQLPFATQWLLDLIKWSRDNLWAVALCVFVPLLLFATVWQTPHLFRRKNGSSMLVTFDLIRWYTPGWSRFERDLSMLHTLEVLRFGVRSGSDMFTIFECIKKLDINTVMYRRIAKWESLLKAGRDVGQAASTAGLGHSLAWAFNGSQEHIEDTLEALESLYRNNLHHRQAVYRSISAPLFQLAMGCVIGLCLVVLFIPIFTLASHIVIP